MSDAIIFACGLLVFLLVSGGVAQTIWAVEKADRERRGTADGVPRRVDGEGGVGP